MPRCATLYVGQVTVSMPFTLIDPVRRPTSPSTDLSVEVRPAPLRPRRVTTSPLFTTMFTPCSTCDSPYHACRFSMRSTSDTGSGPLVMTAHVGLDHLRVGGDLGVRALGQHRAALQHGDGVADAGDHAHVVLDHEHGAPDGHFLDEVLDAVHVLVAHARGGLVEQHELGIHGERGGDLEGALAAVGH